MTRAYQPPSPWRRALRAWFDPRGRGLGFVAFILQRLTGLGLVFYLLLHLVVLSTLLQGEAAWDDFVALAKSPLFLALDMLLILGILIHGLNGLRVTIVGLGFGVSKHKTLFWAMMLITALVFLYAGWLLLAKV
jgi:succinate dehydrogenase / fumarate reductase cytochrome b subunit